MSDVLGLITFAGMVLAVWFAVRRIKSNHVAQVATARVEGIEAGKAAVLADIGASVVVHNHNGDSISGHRLHYHDHDAADVDHDHDGRRHDHIGTAEHRLGVERAGDSGLLLGVPVGTHALDRDGDVRAHRAAALEQLNSDEAHRVLLEQRPQGRGPGA